MNRSAVIIGNGDFPKKEYPLYLLSRADYIVCCDGALDRYLRYTRDHSMTRLPDAVIGDMDSISASSRKKCNVNKSDYGLVSVPRLFLS